MRLRGWKESGRWGVVHHKIRRYGIGDIVRAGHHVKLGVDFWAECIDKLPNPPMPIGRVHGRIVEGRNVPGRILWWDGDNDVVLVKFPAYSGTGHSGIYDRMDDESFFDVSRDDTKAGDDWELGDGCVFVPTSAIDYERSNLDMPTIDTGYKSVLKWPTAPMICNFAQYRMSARVMGETLGVTRQAIHKAIAKLPRTIHIMTGVLNRDDRPVSGCRVPGCDRLALTPDSHHCAYHWGTQNEKQAAAIAKYNAENPAPRPFKARRKRVVAPPPLPYFGVDEFLPLVDQTGIDDA